MSASAGIAEAVPPAPTRAAPPGQAWSAWARANLFGGVFSSVATLILGAAVLWAASRFFAWALLGAVWHVPYDAAGRPDTTACQTASGACWAVIADKYRVILFGRYDYDQQWRPLLVILLFIGLYIVSAMRRFWTARLPLIWAATLTLIGVLMWGGILGLPYVPQDGWGGLPITLILSTFGLAFAFPLGVAAALGRRSKLPALKTLSILYVELIRGVPLVSLLFMASVMFPLFFPPGFNIDKLLRAQIAIILFVGAYVSEVIRGGLQALPKGQYEAADALGLSYWQATRLIVLPQALRLVIPPLVSTFIGFFKDTSLVLIIGILDLLYSGKVALADPAWSAYTAEVYLVIAAIYIAFCFSMARYARGIEARARQGAR